VDATDDLLAFDVAGVLEQPASPDATHERIVEPFFSTRSPTEASELGLATVHAIVNRSRGAISVETARGQFVPEELPAAVAALLRTGEQSQTA
jgi:nitrogen-specific signal transduction histidine kinase